MLHDKIIMIKSKTEIIMLYCNLYKIFYVSSLGVYSI